jgi:hypothetical protein
MERMRQYVNRVSHVTEEVLYNGLIHMQELPELDRRVLTCQPPGRGNLGPPPFT